jgi:hypothetical protein
MIRIILVYFVLVSYSCSDIKETEEYNFKLKEIELNKKSIYIKSASFGVSSDKEILVISDSRSNKINYGEDMVFEGIKNINLYFINNDTLHVVIDLLHAKNKISKARIKIDSTDNQIYYDYYFKNKKLNNLITIKRI